jgi:hypothetical protein
MKCVVKEFFRSHFAGGAVRVRIFLSSVYLTYDFGGRLFDSSKVRPFLLSSYTTLQSIGVFPRSSSALLARLKHREPRKGEFVLVAPSGLG